MALKDIKIDIDTVADKIENMMKLHEEWGDRIGKETMQDMLDDFNSKNNSNIKCITDNIKHISIEDLKGEKHRPKDEIFKDLGKEIEALKYIVQAARKRAHTVATKTQYPVRASDIYNVVGITFEGRMKNVEKLIPDQKVYVETEDDNNYDKNAVKVVNKAGGMLGYIAKKENVEFRSKYMNGLNYRPARVVEMESEGYKVLKIKM